MSDNQERRQKTLSALVARTSLALRRRRLKQQLKKRYQLKQPETARDRIYVHQELI